MKNGIKTPIAKWDAEKMKEEIIIALKGPKVWTSEESINPRKNNSSIIGPARLIRKMLSIRWLPSSIISVGILLGIKKSIPINETIAK